MGRSQVTDVSGNKCREVRQLLLQCVAVSRTSSWLAGRHLSLHHHSPKRKEYNDGCNDAWT
ncbi:hypothetical protein, partial [Parapedobacter tibetensis]|uniref:hypothetical protein n=1 Tax=Parapedobacter tibetensis TaxID=2972951 RepID=UPI00214DAABF